MHANYLCVLNKYTYAIYKQCGYIMANIYNCGVCWMFSFFWEVITSIMLFVLLILGLIKLSFQKNTDSRNQIIGF